jgi:DNA repair protein SbcD/Mre11
VKRLLLVSDLHLDAPFVWAGVDVARRRRHALREVLQRVVSLAAAEQVDALLVGGDLFEHERSASDTAEFLRATFERVQPLPVFIAPGNHDWYGPDSLYVRTAWPANVRIFAEGRLSAIDLDDGLRLWGGAHCVPAGTRNFLEDFTADGDAVHLALFHGSEWQLLPIEGDGKHPHAPFRAEELEAAGLHFAFLGHYHTPRDAPRFTYPGNPEPLTFGETGERGVVLATVDERGRVRLERRVVRVSDVHDVLVGVGGCGTVQDLRQAIEERLQGLGGYARVTLAGDLSPQIDARPADFVDVVHGLEAPPFVRFGDVRPAYDLDAIGQEPTIRGQFVRDVVADQNLLPDQRGRVIVTGLRALDGRADLEVP